MVLCARSGDRSAENRLIKALSPLVHRIAKQYPAAWSRRVYLKDRGSRESARPFDRDDMVQEGFIGLLAAIRRFDPDRGVRLATFAAPRIHGVIKRALSRQVRADRASLVSLDEPAGDEEEGDGDRTLHNIVPDEQGDPGDPRVRIPRLSPLELAEYSEISALFARILRMLPRREQELIRVHDYTPDTTVAESAHRLGMSRPTFYKLREATLGMLRDSLKGLGIGPAEARELVDPLERHRRD